MTGARDVPWSSEEILRALDAGDLDGVETAFDVLWYELPDRFARELLTALARVPPEVLDRRPRLAHLVLLAQRRRDHQRDDERSMSRLLRHYSRAGLRHSRRLNGFTRLHDVLSAGTAAVVGLRHRRDHDASTRIGTWVEQRTTLLMAGGPLPWTAGRPDARPGWLSAQRGITAMLSGATDPAIQHLRRAADEAGDEPHGHFARVSAASNLALLSAYRGTTTSRASSSPWSATPHRSPRGSRRRTCTARRSRGRTSRSTRAMRRRRRGSCGPPTRPRRPSVSSGRSWRPRVPATRPSTAIPSTACGAGPGAPRARHGRPRPGVVRRAAAPAGRGEAAPARRRRGPRAAPGARVRGRHDRVAGEPPRLGPPVGGRALRGDRGRLVRHPPDVAVTGRRARPARRPRRRPPARRARGPRAELVPEGPATAVVTRARRTVPRARAGGATHARRAGGHRGCAAPGRRRGAQHSPVTLASRLSPASGRCCGRSARVTRPSRRRRGSTCR